MLFSFAALFEILGSQESDSLFFRLLFVSFIEVSQAFEHLLFLLQIVLIQLLTVILEKFVLQALIREISTLAPISEVLGELGVFLEPLIGGFGQLVDNAFANGFKCFFKMRFSNFI